jgi:23S rRNA pseudouridine2457 synthase
MNFRYILFHKPYDVVSQFSDRERSSRPTLHDFIQVPEVYPVGRLDRDSEGLMLLTSDGALQHRLTDPRFEHPRTYLAQVEGVPGPEALRLLREGVRIQDYQTRPARVRALTTEPDVAPRDPPVRFRKLIPTSWIELILTEGRNRQVRRMTAAVGFPTLRLIRTAIGELRLEGLAPGEWRDLTSKELRQLRRPLSRDTG